MQAFPKIHARYFWIYLKCQYDKPLQQITKHKVSWLLDESRFEDRNFNLMFTDKLRFECKPLVLSLYIINIELIRKNCENVLKKLIK